MYKLAQGLFRHKLAVVTVLAVGFIVLGGEEEAPQSSSPWAANAATETQIVLGPKEDGFADKAFNTVTGAMKDYTGVDMTDVELDDVNTVAVGQGNSGRMESAAEGMKQGTGSL